MSSFSSARLYCFALQAALEAKLEKANAEKERLKAQLTEAKQNATSIVCNVQLLRRKFRVR